MSEMQSENRSRVAVLIPCYNEAVAIAKVVHDFRQVLPGAAIYVYDNNSKDNTVAVATEAGAIVRGESYQGKGSVVRRMFSDVEADIYILVDGDQTYNAASAPKMIELLSRDKLDMVVGVRKETVAEGEHYRPGHRFGNLLFTQSVAMLFGNRFSDILSGYRCFSRRFVKSFPTLSHGFEIETELTIHSLSLRLPCGEIDTPYSARPVGSESKLSTFRDGWRILGVIVLLMKEFRPALFFGSIAIVLILMSVGLALPIFIEFLHTGKVPRLPTAVLATGIMILAFLLMTAGLILDSLARMRSEMKRLAYLALPAVTTSQQ
jgi:glycosyltransferase involved in cell wall biosynthesis